MASSKLVFTLLFSLLAVVVTSVPRNYTRTTYDKKGYLTSYHEALELDDVKDSQDRSYDGDDDSDDGSREGRRRYNRDDDSDDDSREGRRRYNRDDDSDDDSREGRRRYNRDDDSDDDSREGRRRYNRDEDSDDDSREGRRRYNRDDDSDDDSREGRRRYNRDDDSDDDSREGRRRYNRDDDSEDDSREGRPRYDRNPRYRYEDGFDGDHRSYFYKANNCHEVCGINAVCIKHKCQCRYGFTGNPRFACHEDSSAFCSITNDQSLTTFGREHFSLDPIADVKTAEVTTDRRAKGKGECNLQVWTFFNRQEGKVYVTELQFKLTISSGYRSTENTFKIVTYIDRGVYVFDVYYFDGNSFTKFLYDSSDSPFVVTKSFTIRSVLLKFFRVLPGLLQVELDDCGIKFGVRPHNDNKPQVVPGFMIEVDKSFNPTFYPEDVPTVQICLSENKVNLPKLTTFKEDVDSLVLIALTNSEVEPPFNSTPSNLANLRATLKHCCDEDKLRFVNFYQSVLSKPPFVKAISGGVPGLSELVRFLSLVLKDICGLDPNGCDEAEDLIRQRADKSNVELLKPYCSHYEGNNSVAGRRD